MIDFLEVKEILEVDLWFWPSPQQIPWVFELHAMWELKPSLGTMKTTVNNIIDFFLGPDYSIKLHLAVRWRLELIINSIKHNTIPLMKTVKLNVKQLSMSFSFLTLCNQLKD